MKLGLDIADFTWPAGPAKLGSTLADIARTADQAGFDSIWVMDHFWQIRMNGPEHHEMLEGYSALSYIAAVTRRAKLGTMVTGVVYHQPGILAKTVTTLDVLSGGRAWWGSGAAWNEAESLALVIRLPPIKERFERLEETLQICQQMWEGKRGSEKPYRSEHYQLERPLNSPQSLTRPHPPILIGGGGEKKTLRLVAQYGDARNLFPTPEIPRKLDILPEHYPAGPQHAGRVPDKLAISRRLDRRMGLGRVTLPLADGIDPVQRLRIVGLVHEHQVVVVPEDIPDLVDPPPDQLNLMLQVPPLGRPRRDSRASLRGRASRPKLDQGYELLHGPPPPIPISLSVFPPERFLSVG